MRGLAPRGGVRSRGVRRQVAARALFGLSRRVHADFTQVLVKRPEQHNHPCNKQEGCHKRQESWSTRKVSHVFYPSFVNYPASL